MRRIAATLALLAALGVALVATAGAADTSTYEIEFDNAFGLVNGSEVRVAGVKAGTVSELDINDAKRALITVEVDNQFGEFKSDANCSSEPQSLIAEYFVDCQPGVSPDPLQGPVPVEQTTITVPNDLVQNTLREPFNRQLQLLINEFGTALAGNAENLNAAIRRGAPALRDLKQVTGILADQNTVIRDLNANSDLIVQKLTDNQEDVVRFVKEAGDTAEASAERREDLQLDFQRLPEFLAELKPTMYRLGQVATQGEPLLKDLRRSAKGLNTLADRVPPFNDATSVGLTTLGNAAQVGTRALTNGDDEFRQLSASVRNAPSAVDQIAQFLESLGNPFNAVEEDARARTDLRDQPGEADRRVGLLNSKTGGGVTEPGYSGLEGLLNYVYYQAGALNQFDQIGHLLHFILFEPVVASPCGHFSAHTTYPNGSTNPQSADRCVSILGDNQPGIGGDPTKPTPGLTRYDDSVCPQGSADLDICDPAISTHGASTRSSAGEFSAGAPTGEVPGAPDELLTPEVLDDIAEGKPVPKPLQDALGLPNGDPLLPGDGSNNPLNDTLNQVLGGLGLGNGATGQSPPPQPGDAGATNLLDFLFGT